MTELTDRQIHLLKAIIDTYIQDAEPVGSVEVVKKYNLRYSAATVRNEMAQLFNMGYLEMPHTSSGRVPTKQAYRLYLDQMMNESELPVLQEIALKQRLWPNRFQFERMLRDTVIALSEITKMLSIATTDDGFVVHAGAVNVLDNKEFWEIDVAKAALLLLDNYPLLEKIFQTARYGEDVNCVIEEELGMESLKKCTTVYARYTARNRSGFIAVLGPSRMNYATVIPAVRYSKNLIQELNEAW
jgi:transcriptional regulator of heat shock response